MKVLMFGWEYAPSHTGGLGIVCRELSEALSKNHEITFILPRDSERKEVKEVKEVQLKNASSVKEESVLHILKEQQITYLEVEANLIPYLPPRFFKKIKNKKTTTLSELDTLKSIELTGKYTEKITAEVTKYAVTSTYFYENKQYDIIHAHDWMGLNAGVIAQSILKIPLVAHIHSIEQDRNGASGHKNIFNQEKKGLQKADAIICVSNKTKESLINIYQIEPGKITVVPNATNWTLKKPKTILKEPFKIGFLGRLTHQKGPERFLDLARALSNLSVKFEFTVIGEGYMKDFLLQKTANLNLINTVNFKGFLTPEKASKEISKQDLVVIPSVSEPFGLVALECTAKGVPVIISDNAGVNEFIPYQTFNHWDVFSMKTLCSTLIQNPEKAISYTLDCQKALKDLSWEKSAQMVGKVYQKACKKHSNSIKN